MNTGVLTSSEDTVGVGTLRTGIASTQDVLELLRADRSLEYPEELL